MSLEQALGNKSWLAGWMADCDRLIYENSHWNNTNAFVACVKLSNNKMVFFSFPKIRQDVRIEEEKLS